MAAFGLAKPMVKPAALQKFDERFALPSKQDLSEEALEDLEAIQDSRVFTVEEMCYEYDLDDSDPSRAQSLWLDLGIGTWFDNWLVSHPDKQLWTYTMDEEVSGYDHRPNIYCYLPRHKWR